MRVEFNYIKLGLVKNPSGFHVVNALESLKKIAFKNLGWPPCHKSWMDFELNLTYI